MATGLAFLHMRFVGDESAVQLAHERCPEQFVGTYSKPPNRIVGIEGIVLEQCFLA